ASVTARRRAVVPEIGFTTGGEEGSVQIPMVQAVDLAAQMRSMQARHPQFDPQQFGQRVDRVYHALQRAWSAGQWKDARPYVTDRMYQSLRFWVERYTAHGLRNRLEDVVLRRVRIVKVDLDAWYESITVRLWGAMRDSIVDERGRVVGGNAHIPREFSEYWTFLRSAGTDGTSKGDAPGCPSCGAPLDRVAETGICGYCDSKITTGRFDWVLTRIEQPEAYRG
ncbi:MAG: Tim44-like domain-containing protein, partial [Myxococcota bacterium]